MLPENKTSGKVYFEKFAIPLVFIIVVSLGNKNTFELVSMVPFCIFVILYSGLLVLQVMSGIRRIRESSNKGKNKKKKYTLWEIRQ
jgi:hypothetical protein